jgi:hypothetical protein
LSAPLPVASILFLAFGTPASSDKPDHSIVLPTPTARRPHHYNYSSSGLPFREVRRLPVPILTPLNPNR